MLSRQFARCAVLAFALLFIVAARAEAATLVMVEWEGCAYCQRFHREVGPEYSDNRAGQLAPLRPVSITKWPADLKGLRRVHAVPYFILIDKGREVGRFAGYSGADRFWNSLNSLLSRM
jgi:thioredoxin-related protein